jgi:autotransporter-associated beta strand protein
VGGENVRGLISFGFRTYTYSLVPGLGDTDNAIFSIEGTSLKVAGAIDYEAKSHYTIRVRSTAQDGTWIEEVLSVDATDVNEAPTVVSLGNVTSGLDENTATSSRIKLADVTVTDDALGTNTLSLSGADASSFEIVGTSLYLKAGVTLDYETKPSYAVTVQASDATLPGSMPASQSYTLSVANVNEAPTGLGAFPTSVAENQPVGTTIGTLTTADPDSGDTFTYVLVSGAGDTDNGSFEIVGNALKAKASFNYEAKSSYTVRVRTTDAGGLFTEQQLTVTVTDVNESPTAVNLTNATASLAENTSTSSRIKLADIVVTDDAIGTNILSLSGADASSFEIVGTALYLKSGEGLDFETKVFYAVTVSVADSGLVGPASVRTDYTLGVTNVNEAPTNVALSPSTVAENQAEGASVGTLSSTDEDSGDTFSYTLVPGTGDMDNGSFEIVGGVLKTRAVFDYETKSSYTIRVRTTDTGGLFTEKQLTVTVTDVHDAPTNIALSASSIAENQPAGTTVGSLSTTDQDSVSGFTYSLVTGTGDTDNSSFEIVGGTLKTRAALNYESQSSYTFRVRTTDADGLFTEKQFTIGVTDVNEAPTAVRLVNAFPSIAENTSMVARVKVADIVITDDALGTNTVSLLGTDKSFFELDGLSLYLKAGTALDYGVKTSYDVTVDAADASAVDVVATTPLTVSYGVASGSLMLRNTTAGSLAVESVSILSPTHALSGVAAAPPPAAFTTLNTSDQGLYGRYSEIFFGNVGSAALTLAAGGTWNLGNVAQTGLTSSGITSAFGTDADADPEGRSAAGQFLYSTPDASGMLRGAIVCDISAAFTLRVQNVPEYSGREYAEVAAGQTLIDTTVRTGNRQVIVRGGGTLILAGASTNTGGVKVEGGALVVRNAAALGTGTLDVRAGGVVNLDVGYAKATVGGLTLESGARINLGTGGLQIAAGGTTLDALRSAILLARNGGAWNGTSGIGSASVDVSKSKVVGYRQMPSGAYQVAWAGYGDSNLDGRVNSTDINALNTARKFGLPARDSHWSQGDFTYDGRVSSTDIQLLSAMFGRPSYYASSTAPAAPVSQGNLPAATITAQLFASLGWVDPDGDGKP